MATILMVSFCSYRADILSNAQNQLPLTLQVAAPVLWNVFPREIRSITDLRIFKRHLKTHLFKEAFHSFLSR